MTVLFLIVKSEKLINMLRKTLYIIILCILIFSSISFFDNVPLEAKPEKKESLTVLGSDKFPPYSYLIDNTPSGYFIDLTKLIFSEADIRMDIKLMPWENCLSWFRTGKAAVLLGCPYDEKSERFMSFSDPVYNMVFSVFVNADNRHVTSLRSLEGTIVGVRRWSPVIVNLSKNATLRLVKADSALDALKKLKNREVTAIIVERDTALYYIQKYGIEDIKMLEDIIPVSFAYCFALGKGNEKLLTDLNRAIERVTGADTYDMLKRRWFGTAVSRPFPWGTVITIAASISGLLLLLSGALWVFFLNSTIKKKTRQIKEMHLKMVETDKLAVLGKLAGQIAHELRTPLSIIHNSVYLLGKEGGEDKALFEKRLGVLEEKVKLCSNILESILSYSRVKAETVASVSVKECVEEVLHDLNLPKEITTDVSFENEGALTVFMDLRQLYSVLRNLFLNSIQAMNNKGRLEIKVLPSDKGRTVTIRISDTGPGIVESARNKIFNLFYSSNITNTGLGLPISRSIIEANNGELYLGETSHRGSCFIIKLPSSRGKKI